MQLEARAAAGVEVGSGVSDVCAHRGMIDRRGIFGQANNRSPYSCDECLR